MEKREIVREWLGWQKWRDPFPAFELAEAIEATINGMNDLADPPVMHELLGKMWIAYGKAWVQEHEKIMSEVLGSAYKGIKDQGSHRPKEVARIFQRILERIREQCGEIRLGIDVSAIEVNDIILDELTLPVVDREDEDDEGPSLDMTQLDELDDDSSGLGGLPDFN